MSKSDLTTAGRAPTADDVARLAGVSRSAVSRTFTAGASVAPATRKKVLQAADAIGYRVNFLARSLSQQRTSLVGLVVADMDNSFRGRLVDHLSRSLVKLEYRPFLLPGTRGDEDDVRHITDMMLHYKLSGAIVTSDNAPAEIAERCAAHDVPLVLVNKPEAGGKVANVTLDCDKAGRLAAEALRRAGCRTVAFASQRRPSHTISLRKRAFEQACRDLGMEIIADFKGGAQDYDGGVEAAKAFADGHGSVDGIYCVNDYLALGFLDYLRHATEISVPGDLKLVACDDIAEAAWLSYDLTTVRQDSAVIAEAAIAALIARIENPAVMSPPTFIDVSLVERGTTRGTCPSSTR